jgi:serine/threonine-protein kinase HipA
MRTAAVYVNNLLAGYLKETEKQFVFEYQEGYTGHPVSLTMPVAKQKFLFDVFPTFFDGLLPEGQQLDGLLRQQKLDRTDYFGQLLAVGNDLVGAVTVQPT